MDARDLYRQRLMSAEKAVAPIKSGQQVLYYRLLRLLSTYATDD